MAEIALLQDSVTTAAKNAAMTSSVHLTAMNSGTNGAFDALLSASPQEEDIQTHSDEQDYQVEGYDEDIYADDMAVPEDYSDTDDQETLDISDQHDVSNVVTAEPDQLAASSVQPHSSRHASPYSHAANESDSGQTTEQSSTEDVSASKQTMAVDAQSSAPDATQDTASTDTTNGETDTSDTAQTADDAAEAAVETVVASVANVTAAQAAAVTTPTPVLAPLPAPTQTADAVLGVAAASNGEATPVLPNLTPVQEPTSDVQPLADTSAQTALTRDLGAAALPSEAIVPTPDLSAAVVGVQSTPTTAPIVQAAVTAAAQQTTELATPVITAPAVSAGQANEKSTKLSVLLTVPAANMAQSDETKTLDVPSVSASAQTAAQQQKSVQQVAAASTLSSSQSATTVVQATTSAKTTTLSEATTKSTTTDGTTAPSSLATTSLAAAVAASGAEGGVSGGPTLRESTTKIVANVKEAVSNATLGMTTSLSATAAKISALDVSSASSQTSLVDKSSLSIDGNDSKHSASFSMNASASHAANSNEAAVAAVSERVSNTATATATMRTTQTSQAAATPTQQVVLTIRSQVKTGQDHLTLSMSPPELGKVEIKLSVSVDKTVQATVTADNKSTLDLLKQDQRQLQQALTDAGLKPDQNSLQFNLRDQNQQGQAQGETETADQKANSLSNDAGTDVAQTSQEVTETESTYYITPSGVNITV